MEQHQFKVSWSVGTKLLVSVVALLFVAILFLDVSTIILLEKDKRAFTYQSQTTEAQLLGREFMGMVTHATDSMRQGLALIDSEKLISPQLQAQIDSLVANQSAVTKLKIVQFSKNLNQWKLDKVLATTQKAELVSQFKFRGDDFEFTGEEFKAVIPDLKKQGISFFNHSKLGRPPLMAIFFADLGQQKNVEQLVAAVGFVGLSEFGKGIKASNLILVNQEGWVLFNSDLAGFFSKRSIADDPLFEAASANNFSSGALEYRDGTNRYLGSFVRPGFGLIALTKTDFVRAMSASYALTEKFILLGLMSIGAAIIFAQLFSRSITAPIKSLYQATMAVASGNFNVQLKASSKDELGALSHSFVFMSKKINELIQEVVRKAHLENELAIASTVQQTLIPPSHYETDFARIYSHYQAASECGGDWYGFFEVQGRLCVMIADATGHGLPSALITASARSCFSVMQKLAEEDPHFTFSPGAMLSYANRVVHDAASGKIMMTFFIGTFDFKNGKLVYASAGHNPPWLFKKNGEKFTLKSLTAMGQRLGEVHDVESFEEHSVDIGLGDILFIYTDGLMEGKNTLSEMFGKKRVRKRMESEISNGTTVCIQTVLKEFLEFNGDKPLDDDVTLAAIEVKKLG